MNSYKRLLNISSHRSFFLFGARGTGKTTYLEENFKNEAVLWLDLLDVSLENKLQKKPSLLKQMISAIKDNQDHQNKNINKGEAETKEKRHKNKWIVIDEIQKIPELLNIVHQEIEKKKYFFILTGSSARKLRRGAANLLAGRALENYLYPLTYLELGKDFDLDMILQFGSLPEIFSLDVFTKKEYLRTYVNTYLKEEIQVEQLVRKLTPFRSFLEIAGQSSGEIINYSNIARDINSDPVSVRSYFEILEDTLIGNFLPSFHYSIRKRQRSSPKFYLFDIGVKRALEGKLNLELSPKSFEYGILFEHFIINEVIRLNQYFRLDYKFYYLRTKDDIEIDLIIERPGLPFAFIEIKSTDNIHDSHVKNLSKLTNDFIKENKRSSAEAYVFSNDLIAKKIDNVNCLHWKEGLDLVFTSCYMNNSSISVKKSK